MNTLIERVAIAVANGAVPRAIPGESYDDLRFRVAHAGAIIGYVLAQEEFATAQRLAAVTQGDVATVTPMPVYADAHETPGA